MNGIRAPCPSLPRDCDFVGVRAPDQYPQEVWDELVRQKRLTAGRDGIGGTGGVVARGVVGRDHAAAAVGKIRRAVRAERHARVLDAGERHACTEVRPWCEERIMTNTGSGGGGGKNPGGGGGGRGPSGPKGPPPNAPSTTGKPSGPGRGNNPPSK